MEASIIPQTMRFFTKNRSVHDALVFANYFCVLLGVKLFNGGDFQPVRTKWSYFGAFVLLSIYVGTICMKTTVKLGEVGILDMLYDVPLLGVLFLTGLMTMLRLISKPDIFVALAKEVGGADEILQVGYNIRWNYRSYFVVVTVAISVMLLLIVEFCITMYYKGSFLMIVLAIVVSLANCQGFAPLFVVMFVVDSGFRKTKTSVRILRGVDGERMDSGTVRRTLNEIVQLNFLIVGASRRATAFGKINFGACFYTSLYPFVLGIVSMKTSSTSGGKDLIMMGIFLTTVFVVMTNVFQRFLNEQKNLATALNDLALRNTDSSVDTVRQIFLLQLMHHRVDSSDGFLINRRLILKCISILCGVTMFLFRLYPELIH